MSRLRLVLANLRRKKLRTALTFGSFAVALFLFGLLETIHAVFYQGLEVAGVDRLVVINKVSLIQPLPFSYRDRLLQIPGVAAVTYANWFGGVYQNEKNFFPQFAVDHESFRKMFSEFVIPDEEWRAFAADREGCVVGASLAKRFNWKIGDRIPIKGTIFPGVWEFNVRAIYQGSRRQDDTTQFWFRYDYLEERAPRWFKGIVGWYTVRVTSPDDAVRVAKAIDVRFENSPWETRTETEKAFATSFVKQMGNIELLMMLIGAVVFLTLLLVTGNTMAITVRERTGELAVLKTVGFSDVSILALVLGETALVAAAGGATGLGLVKLFTLGGDPTGGMLPAFFLPGGAVIQGFALALAVGLLAGLLPALGAMRLRVVDALRRV